MIMIPTDRPVRSVERKRLTICLRIPPFQARGGDWGDAANQPGAWEPHGERMRR
jgi:hypothetical protein